MVPPMQILIVAVIEHVYRMFLLPLYTALVSELVRQSVVPRNLSQTYNAHPVHVGTTAGMAPETACASSHVIPSYQA